MGSWWGPWPVAIVNCINIITESNLGYAAPRLVTRKGLIAELGPETWAGSMISGVLEPRVQPTQYPAGNQDPPRRWPSPIHTGPGPGGPGRSRWAVCTGCQRQHHVVGRAVQCYRPASPSAKPRDGGPRPIRVTATVHDRSKRTIKPSGRPHNVPGAELEQSPTYAASRRAGRPEWRVTKVLMNSAWARRAHCAAWAGVAAYAS